MKYFFCVSMMLMICYAHAATQPERRQLTVVEQTAIGGGAGTIETVLNHPFFRMKNYIQQLRAQGLTGSQALNQAFKEIRIYPPMLYSGVVANAANMIPTTAVQVGLHQAIAGMMPGETMAQQLAGAALAGAGGAPLCNAVELLIIQKQNAELSQKCKVSIHSIVQSIYHQRGISGFARGLGITMLREGGWAAGYMALPSMLKKYTEHATDSGVAAHVSACIGAGIITGAATQPFDTIKTLVQADTSSYKTAREIATHLYRSQGLRAFYSGFGWRTSRIASAILVIDAAQKHLKRLVIGQDQDEQ